jgi:tetratricopeptide (TPR) repeat protein
MLALLLVCSAAVAAPDAAGLPATEEIARAIRELGAAEFAVRQAATDLLWKAGPAAEPALRSAMRSTDPEVRTRSAALLGRLELGITPDTPAEIAVLIDQFRFTSDPNERRQAIRQLQAKGQWQSVMTLIRHERDPQQRRLLGTVVAADASKLIRPLVARGELAQAGEFLELISASDAGRSQWAAFLLLTGGLERAIDELRSKAASAMTAEDAARLAFLLRAQGDKTGAIEAAANAGDMILRINLLAEAQQWADAAPLAEQLLARNPQRLEAGAFAATFYRLAGQTADYERIIERLSKAARIDELTENPSAERANDPFATPPTRPVQTSAWTVAETLLVNEQAAAALPILRKTQPQWAHLIHWRQHRHAEALELVGIAPDLPLDQPLDRAWFNKLPAPPGDANVQQAARFALAIQVARHLKELGRRKQAEQMIADVLYGLASAPGDRGQRLTQLATLNWQLGRFDEVPSDAAQAIAAGAAPAGIYKSLLKTADPLAAPWYELLLRDDPLADRQKTFAKALWLTVPQPPRDRVPADWRQVIAAAQAAAAKLSPAQKAQRLYLLGQTCEIRGDRKLAAELFGEAAAYYAAAALKAADLKLADEDWSGAAGLYQRAAKTAADEELAGFLHGYVLAQAGDEAAGKKLMQGAALAALAPEARLKLAEGLAARGLKREAIEQFELARRTALPDSTTAATAAQKHGNLINRQEPSPAADDWQQLLLHVLNANTNFTEVEHYLSLTQLVHQMRIRAALAAGDKERVQAELARCEAILPADIRLLVALIPRLDRGGMRELADDLFARGLTAHQTTLAQFPESATFLNNAAWLCARSQRKLDEALALATKATELAPTEASYQDTLAEVHFQRGDRAPAVAAAERAAERSPLSKLFAARLKHFQEDELKTLDGSEAD